MRKRICTKQLSKLIASQAGFHPKFVHHVVRLLTQEIFDALDRGEPVWLRNIGTLCWVPVRGSKGYKLRFKPTERLRGGRAMMDKYGVQLDDEKTKQAGEGQGPRKCLVCGRELDNGGACPEHGTEPLEKKPEDK